MPTGLKEAVLDDIVNNNCTPLVESEFWNFKNELVSVIVVIELVSIVVPFTSLPVTIKVSVILAVVPPNIKVGVVLLPLPNNNLPLGLSLLEYLKVVSPATDPSNWVSAEVIAPIEYITPELLLAWIRGLLGPCTLIPSPFILEDIWRVFDGEFGLLFPAEIFALVNIWPDVVIIPVWLIFPVWLISPNNWKP